MSSLKLLAIETSSPLGSIALGVGDDITERTIATPREQTTRVLAIINELLADAGLKLDDLDALVFGRGPGSFTGIRVAAAVTQGLSLASGRPIVSISSLAVLAQRGDNPNDAADAASTVAGSGVRRTLCCLDARMNEVYWASFTSVDGLVEAESEERIGPPEAVTGPPSPFLALGDGFAAYSQVLAPVIKLAEAVDTSMKPGARELLTLGAADVRAGRFVSLEAALPVYLREADAWRRG